MSSQEGWQTSVFIGGTPGEGQIIGPPGNQLPGDINQDGGLDLSDAVGLLLYLFSGAPTALPCGDGTAADDGNVSLLDANGDQAIDLADVLSTLSYLFAHGPPHVAGTRCIDLPTCPAACTR